MNRVQGIGNIPLIECINRYIGKYRIRWDIQPIASEDDKNAVTFLETEIISTRKPHINTIRQAILEGVNKMVDDKILTAFTWHDHPIWLSQENQFNYKAAYDLAVQTQGGNLPVVFKFGTTEEPVYHKFDTLEELSDFYINSVKFISTTLAEGWYMKDNIDWNAYERLLNEF